MVAKGGDEQRALKWADRACEWQRLSALTTNEHIAERCRKEVEFARTMAHFWATGKT